MSPITITPAALRLLQMCRRRVWLDHYGDLSQRDLLPPMLVQRFMDGQRHEQTILWERESEIVHVKDWAEGVRLTQTWMEQGAKSIDGAFLEVPFQLDSPHPVTIRGRADRLVRGRGGIYAPIEIKQYTRLASADYLQMDLYVWMLAQLQGAEAPGEFWLGRDPVRRVRHDYQERRLMEALREAAFVLTDAEPQVVLRSHCKECPWHTPCKSLAAERLDVSLLSGLRQDTRKHFAAMGIVSLEQVAEMSPDDLRKFKGIKSTAVSVHAHARAWVSRAPVWYGSLAQVCYEGGWMFDIETEPLTGVVWCIGWSDAQDNCEVALVAPQVRKPERYRLPDAREIILVPDADSAWEAFAAGVSGDHRPIFHWTGFDAGVMHRTAPEGVKTALAVRLHDLHHIVNQSVRFPTKSTSIKAISAYLNFNYSAYEAWDAALNDYNLWLSRGDDVALARACSYQRDDVLAMNVVWRFLVENGRS
jgi:predicted RecB family nuclease